MKSRVYNFLLLLILVIGLSLVAYPTFADYWNSFHQSRAIASYVEQIAQIDPDKYTAYFEEADRYNESLIGRGLERFEPDEEELELYNSLLNVGGSGIIGTIEIPKIGVSLPLYHGTSDGVLQIAIGHVEGTSLPTGSEGTHVVVSGHRGLPSARLFTDLDKMEIGDEFVMQVLDRTQTYEVDQIRIVLPYELDSLEIEEDQTLCTLVTCTPYGINSHRMLIRGHRVENREAARSIHVTADAIRIEPILVAPVVAVPLLLMLFSMLMFSTRKKK